MFTGIQLPNHTQRLSNIEIERLKALDPECIRSYTYTTSEQYGQVMDVVQHPIFIVRPGLNGRIRSNEWMDNIWNGTQLLRDWQIPFWLNPANEPNHPSGPYRDPEGYNQFYEDYGPLVGACYNFLPNVPLVSPNLAVRHYDLEWAAQCEPLFKQHHYIGANAYWQYDNHLEPTWGLRVKLFREIYPDKEFVVLEIGDSTPDRSSAERAARIKANMTQLRLLSYVAAASIFILGYDESAPETWSEFVYDPADLAEIRRTGYSIDPMKRLVEIKAAEHGIDVDIALKIVDMESGFNPFAISSVGALGLMQLRPQYYPGVNYYDPEENLEAGMAALRNYLDRFDNDWAKVLSAYNAGPTKTQEDISKYGANWWLGMYDETRRYIRAILY